MRFESKENIWVYWEGGKLPPVIELCLATIRKHNPNRLYFLTRSILERRFPSLRIPPGLAPVHVSEIVRYHILADRGGIWLDADMICFRSLDPLFDLLKEKRFMIYPTNGAFMASLPGSPEAEALLATALASATSGEKMTWGQLGPRALLNLSRTTSVHMLPRHQFERLSKHRALLLRKGTPEELATLDEPDAYCSHITHWIYERVKKWGDRTLMKSGTLLGHQLRRALA